MDPVLGAALALGAIAAVIGGYFLLAAGLWDLLRRLFRFLGLLRTPSEPATTEQVQEVKQKVDELKQLLEDFKAGSTPEGAPGTGTDALARVASAKTATAEEMEDVTQRPDEIAMHVRPKARPTSTPMHSPGPPPTTLRRS